MIEILIFRKIVVSSDFFFKSDLHPRGEYNSDILVTFLIYLKKIANLNIKVHNCRKGDSNMASSRPLNTRENDGI